MNEPTTVLTDLLLAVLAIVLARRLALSAADLSGRLWAASFVALAVAAAAGGAWHGIPPDLLPTPRYHLWSVTYAAIGFADLLMLAGVAWAALSRTARVAALGLLVGRFVLYAILMLGQRDFRYVVYDYGVTLLLLAGFGFDLLRRGERASRFVLAGAFVSFAGGLVQALRLSLHAHFNHNDLFHVIQMAGIGFFFRAGLLLRGR